MTALIINGPPFLHLGKTCDDLSLPCRTRMEHISTVIFDAYTEWVVYRNMILDSKILAMTQDVHEDVISKWQYSTHINNLSTLMDRVEEILITKMDEESNGYGRD